MTIAQAHSLVTAPHKDTIPLHEHEARRTERQKRKQKWIDWQVRRLDGSSV